MKREANIQRMTEKQKEAKLAVCIALCYNYMLYVVRCGIFLLVKSLLCSSDFPNVV